MYVEIVDRRSTVTGLKLAHRLILNALGDLKMLLANYGG